MFGLRESPTKQNEEKAELLYRSIDDSAGFFAGHAQPDSRSRMNVTFRLPSADLDARFVAEAAELAMSGRIDPSSLELDAAVSGKAGNIGRFQELLGTPVAGALEFGGTVTGPLRAPELQVVASLEQPAFDTLRARYLRADLTQLVQWLHDIRVRSKRISARTKQ